METYSRKLHSYTSSAIRIASFIRSGINGNSMAKAVHVVGEVEIASFIRSGINGNLYTPAGSRSRILNRFFYKKWN